MVEVTAEQTDHEPSVTRYTFAVNGDMMKAEIEGDTVFPVRAINKEYLFGLRANPHGSGYIIHTLEANDSLSPNAEEEVNFQINQLREFAGMPHWFWGKPFSKLLNDPAFQIHKVNFIHHDGRQLVRIDCEYQSDDPSEVLGEGSYVVLDPDNYWGILCSFTIRRWSNVHVTNAYGDSIDGFPAVEQAIITHEIRDPEQSHIQLKWSFRFEKFQRANVPESEFTLSAYGFSEPDMIALRSRLTLPQLMQDAMCRIGQAAAGWQSASETTVEDK